ncbi:hypothetical protein QK290_07270 [Pseudarthrobacter sp. AL07]|uniref:hypothetical protein n=1 Tax=Pseudarthrobacter sp. AL07 TaxID=3042233 RepID=UPI00249C7DA3|nr:hypothetical protein [Pseudarthrobacter sp. AL07]MDI3208319.1 hypothetical protein [Pseudarthrobacter sp. AL07]
MTPCLGRVITVMDVMVPALGQGRHGKTTISNSAVKASGAPRSPKGGASSA